MTTVTALISRRVRVFALAALAIMLLQVSSVKAQDQTLGMLLWWDEDGSSFKTFGPNEDVTISLGMSSGVTCGGILPVTHIYVVNVSSLSDGQDIVDVSN